MKLKITTHTHPCHSKTRYSINNVSKWNINAKLCMNTILIYDNRWLISTASIIQRIIGIAERQFMVNINLIFELFNSKI